MRRQSIAIERSKYFPLLLRVQVLVAGASIMVLELLGSRILAPFYGSTLFVWGSLIGVVLVGLSMGYYYGGKRADIDASYTAFSLLIFGAGAYTLLSTLTSAEIFRLVLALNLGERYGPLGATILLLFLPSFLLGAVSPYAIKLSARSLERVGTTAGNIYSLSTVGSIAGTFATTFILIPELGVNTILYSLSTILIFVSLVGLANRFRVAALFLIAFSLISSSTFQLAPGGVTYQKDTLYHRLVVQDDPISGLRTLLLDNHFHSSMDLRDPQRIVYAYTKYFHLAFAFNPKIDRVLFIGGGGFSGPKRFLADYPNVTVDVVEIDPDVISVAKEYFMVQEDKRLGIYDEDGRTFLSRSRKSYDLVVLDAYAKSYVPFHLMTREFHEIVYDHLDDDGVVISNIITSLTGSASGLFMSEYRTMGDVYQSIYVYPVSGDAGGIVQNVMILAQKGEHRFTIDELKERVDGKTKVDLDEIFSREYKVVRSLAENPILTDDFAPVENFLNPLTGRTYLKEIILANNTIITQPQEVQLNLKLTRGDPGSVMVVLYISLIGFILLVLLNYISSSTRRSKG